MSTGRQEKGGHARAAITAVLVLYRQSPETSASFTSLRAAFAGSASLATRFSLVLYDNSPQPQHTPHFPAPLLYVSDTANGGVAAAYNAGLQQARSDGSQWLLLLDQDTALTTEFLEELSCAVGSVPHEVVAIVPRLEEHGRTHSPHLLPRLTHRALAGNMLGVLPQPVSAFNSGAAIRTDAVSEFPRRYWLDALDHVIFHLLQKDGGKVFLLEARLQHRLSIQQLGEDASLERYRNVLLAERDFYRDYGSRSQRMWYRVRRLKQTLGHVIKVRDKRFALLSLRAVLGLLGPTPTR